MSVKLSYEACKYNELMKLISLHYRHYTHSYYLFHLPTWCTVYNSFFPLFRPSLQPEWNFKTWIFTCPFFNKILKYSSRECRNYNVQKSYLAPRSFHSVIPLTVYLLADERPVNKNTFDKQRQRRRYLFPLLLPRANEKTYFFDSLNPTTHTSP